mmetsp:Transcript_64483/g.144749  ORF Transcript_64483/g.144749 Transcript_64483/m.144749 type:complete len:325 (+) Transcript_64483:94-1068(+)
MPSARSDSNTVDILQPGCSGGLAFLCGGTFPPAILDSRLELYLTQKEYEHTIELCNHTLMQARKRSGLFCVTVLLCTLVFAIAAACLMSLHKQATTECGALDGECSLSMGLPTIPRNAEEGNVTDTCCIWRCCDSETCYRVNSTDEIECDCKEDGNSQKDAKIVCNTIRMYGPKRIKATENAWVVPLAGCCVLSILICCCFNYGQSIMIRSGLVSKMNSNFGNWKSKGLSCNYFPGSNHSKARITVYLPEGSSTVPPRVMGAQLQAQPLVASWKATAQSRTMRARVPQGAEAGTNIQIQAPTGELLQVQVPDGIGERGDFTVLY